MTVEDEYDFEFEVDFEELAEPEPENRDHDIESLDELVSENIGLITGMLG